MVQRTREGTSGGARRWTACGLGLAVLTACPAPALQPEQLVFACQDDGDCVAPQRCVRSLCETLLDAGLQDLRPGEGGASDRLAADQPGVDRTDAGALDAAAADLRPLDGAADATAPPDAGDPDGAVPVDGGPQDQDRAEASPDAAAAPDALVVDAPVDDLGPPTAQTLAVDLAAALGSDATFSAVVPVRDEQDQPLLLFGPAADGSAAVRTQLDGSAPQAVRFEFTQDTTGNAHRNSCRSSEPACQPTYPSIGRAGCTDSTPACGPDNENGRGLFASGSMKGGRWLVLAGARSAGDLDYVYLTPDAPASPTFRHVDLSAALGGGTKGVSAMHVFNDNLYLGFPDTGGSKPYLLELRSVPPEGGLEAVLGTHVFNLKADDIPELGGEQNIDQIWSLNDHLYVVNSGGCRYSAGAAPEVCVAPCPSIWPSCSPDAAAYASRASVATSKVSELLPRDRAWVGPAFLDGHVVMGRNTTLGPQLWLCDPGLTGAPLICEPPDWTLIAANGAGDVNLSQFDDPDLDRLSLVASVGGVLYLGYDGAQGAVVFRATQRLPRQRYHFEGEASCNAQAHPASCAGIGGNGLGAPAATTRILDSAVVDEPGAQALLLVVGNEGNVPRVVRVR